MQGQTKIEELKHFDLPLKPLAKFEQSSTNQEQLGILFDSKKYLELVNATGSSSASCRSCIHAYRRIIGENKKAT